MAPANRGSGATQPRESKAKTANLRLMRSTRERSPASGKFAGGPCAAHPKRQICRLKLKRRSSLRKLS